MTMTTPSPHSAPPATSNHSPVVDAHLAQRAADLQLRLADRITAFAGSMWFVYISAIAFAVWMLLAEKKPWATLTLVVSLEAIFLSTFVMIGQNRAAAFQQSKADHDFQEQEIELHDNTALTRQILDLTQQVHDLAQQIHAATVSGQQGGAPTSAPATAD